MRYSVRVFEVFSYDIEVDADSEDDAKDKVEEMIADDFCGQPEYDYTLGKDEWSATEL